MPCGTRPHKRLTADVIQHQRYHGNHDYDEWIDKYNHSFSFL